MEEIKAKPRFEGSFVVPRSDNCKGLAMLWRREDFTVVVGHSLRHIDLIDLEVKPLGEPSYRLTGFYGWPNRSYQA